HATVTETTWSRCVILYQCLRRRRAHAGRNGNSTIYSNGIDFPSARKVTKRHYGRLVTYFFSRAWFNKLLASDQSCCQVRRSESGRCGIERQAASRNQFSSNRTTSSR